MAIIANPEGAPKLAADELAALLTKANIKIPDASLEDWRVLLGSFDEAAKTLLVEDDFVPRVDLGKYPRKDIFVPQDSIESDEGGWTTRCTVAAKTPTSTLLQGRTVAIKDNIAVAGVRCLNGMKPSDGRDAWVPQVDATVVTRILDASGVINGKTACENNCTEPSSDTSVSGVVHNVYGHGYSCGGSSSGSGRVVQSGAADMSLGCDQGGSVRIPSAFCGLVGLKPTWGLVPYTGILGLHAEIDHCGPMTRTVSDNALLLEVIAGPDGLDDRQPSAIPREQLAFSSSLSSFLASAPSDKPLIGFKIGLLAEGFGIAVMDPNIEAAARSACDELAALGAEVTKISIPDHHALGNAWTCTLPLAGGRDGLLGDRTGRKELYMGEKAAGPNASASQEQFDNWSTSGQNLYLRYLYTQEKYGTVLHAKAANLIRKYRQSYDAALSQLDAVVMPTLPMAAPRSFLEGDKSGPLARMLRIAGILHNTAPFDSTGHPAISVPVGFVPAIDDRTVKLPAGLQIVAKHFDDVTCLKIAAVLERHRDWKSLAYGF